MNTDDQENIQAVEDTVAIRLSDLPEDLQEMVQIIGFKNVILLVKRFGGDRIHLPQYPRLLKKARDRLIRAQFDGSNYAALGRKYGVTARWVRMIVSSSL